MFRFPVLDCWHGEPVRSFSNKLKMLNALDGMRMDMWQLEPSGTITPQVYLIPITTDTEVYGALLLATKAWIWAVLIEQKRVLKPD